jgi:hypothetical protein
MTKRIGIVAVFLAGCAVGGASAQLVVPQANAQQAATLTKWEYYCVSMDFRDSMTPANKLGAEGWEMVTYDAGAGLGCFKRPKL